MNAASGSPSAKGGGPINAGSMILMSVVADVIAGFLLYFIYKWLDDR